MPLAVALWEADLCGVTSQGDKIRMFFYAPSISREQQGQTPGYHYYSVEFPLGATQPVYQFKLWQSECNSFFLLAKDGSDLVSKLKVGHIVPMKYYSEDAMRANEMHDTKIIEIVNETDGRFRGHYRVELNIIDASKSGNPEAKNNDR
jgi:hypothetical protein